mgnify:CR=1 FL=1
MKVGSLVRLSGSPWFGTGLVVDLKEKSANVFFPNASIEHYPYDKTLVVHGVERLEVICE